MSGHSKYSTIKHHKAIQDAKRAKKFLNFLKRISHEATINPNPETNSSLKNWITLASKNNIPKNTILKAISKATVDKQKFSVCFYEGIYASKIYFMLSCLTNNVNRTNAEVKTFFKKNHATLCRQNSCTYLFDKLFLIIVKKINDEKILTEIRTNSLVIYEEFADECHYFYYLFEQSQEMINYLSKMALDLVDAKVSYYPKSKLVGASEEKVQGFAEFTKRICQLADVEDMWANI